jgi:hypothetical protein
MGITKKHKHIAIPLSDIKGAKHIAPVFAQAALLDDIPVLITRRAETGYIPIARIWKQNPGPQPDLTVLGSQAISLIKDGFFTPRSHKILQISFKQRASPYFITAVHYHPAPTLKSSDPAPG